MEQGSESENLPFGVLKDRRLDGKRIKLPAHFKVDVLNRRLKDKKIDIENISRGGLCLKINAPIVLPENFTFLFRISDQKMTVHTRGRMAWHKAENGYCLIGIQFSFYSPEDRERYYASIIELTANEIISNIDFSEFAEGNF